MKVFCKEFITVWTRGLVSWLSRKFDSISIDLTPVEEKLDDVKSDVADVKTAVENFDFTPTVEIDGSDVRFHHVTLAQMEKMHIRATRVSMIGFTLTKGENDFELRFSSDSPQEIAGQLVLGDSIDIVDDVFGTITIPLEAYVVIGVYIDGVDANLLEADINWRLADIQKRIGEGGEDPNSKALAQFFGLPQALPGSYVPASTQQILTELENIWQDVTGETAPLESFVCNNFRREVHNGVVSYHDVDENILG